MVIKMEERDEQTIDFFAGKDDLNTRKTLNCLICCRDIDSLLPSFRHYEFGVFPNTFCLLEAAAFGELGHSNKHYSHENKWSGIPEFVHLTFGCLIY